MAIVSLWSFPRAVFVTVLSEPARRPTEVDLAAEFERSRASFRRGLSTVSTFAELDSLLGGLDPEATLPATERGKPRGRQGTPRAHVTLPYGWLDSHEAGTQDLSEAESDVSGG